MRGTFRGTGYLVAGFVGITVVVLAIGNILFSSARTVPYRALDPQAENCRQDAEAGWDVLARPAAGGRTGAVGNDEWAAIDMAGPGARPRLSCSIQRHALPGYRASDGSERRLAYDLAFIELQEDGKPFVLRESCKADQAGCRDEGYGPVRKQVGGRSQLQALLDHLDPARPNYVLVFIHGWRHNADIGDSNVGDFRHYAAHAARFIEDRFAADPEHKPRVTAIYVGWRGARTDETWLKRKLGTVGEWLGTLAALPTLFDRKPVSEAVAPAALSALRAIEHRLRIDKSLPSPKDLPVQGASRMIVFGHSLGGNMLATALQDDLVKKVSSHAPGTYMLPSVGDLVVLINPAAEASKWVDVQRALWRRIPMSFAERASGADYSSGHRFFRPEQRPVLVSVTAALDWPPGGRTETDCKPPKAGTDDTYKESRALVRDGVEYDWATYDLFPAFKGDFRPAADSLVRLGTGRDPHDQCLGSVPLTWQQKTFGWLATLAARGIRVLPFMRTDLEDTRTIGHLDPSRPAQGGGTQNYFPTRPFGTTHELRGRPKGEPNVARKWRVPVGVGQEREIPVDYAEVVGPDAACPVAKDWLATARARQEERDHGGHGTYWASDDAGAAAPALQFLHGFNLAGIAAITRARDPFWNMRAFDTALARHDGFMLSSFICALNQLVMDDITGFTPPTPPPGAAGSAAGTPALMPEPVAPSLAQP
ncbi:hypothetical protein ACFQ12_08630 [Methylobacterium trifolii]